MADTYTVFAHKLIPGTQRDSLHVLDGLLANQTGIQPEMGSTDTAGASEIVFALAWTLGYRWAPRLADLPDPRLWRIDREARYGPLNGLARNASTPGSSPATGTRSAGSPPRCGPAPSSPRRSCARCSAAPAPPASPVPWPSSAG
jgi:Tn3 transposase DDE domain